MASLDSGGDGGGHKKGPGVKKAKKMSTRVDMTPMVDLGFLLITFFIFTATMNTPTTMNLLMPKDTDNEEEQNKAKQSGALTIMLGKDNHVYYYEGQLEPDGSNFKTSTYKDIRQVIIDKKKDVMSRYAGDPDCENKKIKDKMMANPGMTQDEAQKLAKTDCSQQDLVVVIKPTDGATYKNTVDMLDEMTINLVNRYALVDIAESEQALVDATEGGGAAPAAAGGQ